MTSSVRIESAGLTDPGVVRSFNEDSLVSDHALGLFVLADGMGGYKAGDVASTMATSAILEDLRGTLNGGGASPPQEGLSRRGAALKAAVERANRAIYRSAQSDTACHGMGTTVVALLLGDGRATVAHVGDSRLYRLRHGRFELLTHDHSLLQEQVEMGIITSEDAKISHNRNLVTRALGVGPEVEVDVREETAVPGDVYLLCSDGLNDMVDETDIELAVAELNANLPLTASQLVQMANDNGGHDNISVLLVKIADPARARSGLADRLLGWLRG